MRDRATIKLELNFADLLRYHAAENATASLWLTFDKKLWNMPRLHSNGGQHPATGMYMT